MALRGCRALFLAIVCTSLPAGCGTIGTVGHFDVGGFESDRFRYAVRPEVGDQILPAEWHLENYRRENGTLVPRTDEDYVARWSFDLNEDGTEDASTSANKYELLYENRRTGARIAVRAIPLDSSESQRDLAVLMRDYVESMSGRGIVAAAVGPRRVEITERHYATRITHAAAVTLAGLEGRVVDIDVGNVDQIQMNANAVSERAEILFVRTPFRMGVSRPGEGAASARVPVLLLAMVWGQPDSFQDARPMFENLVGRIRFLDAPANVPYGVQVVHDETPPPPPPQAEPTPPPPPVQGDVWAPPTT